MCLECKVLRIRLMVLQQRYNRLQQAHARLKRTVCAVARFCQAVNNKAASVTSQHQPRGTWALWRGRGEVARQVLAGIAKGLRQ